MKKLEHKIRKLREEQVNLFIEKMYGDSTEDIDTRFNEINLEIEKEKKMEKRIWNYLIESGIATEEELDLVTDVAGYSVRTLEAVIYSRTGYNDLEQLMEEMGEC